MKTIQYTEFQDLNLTLFVTMYHEADFVGNKQFGGFSVFLTGV
jgi:hypothetical protein